MTGGPLDLESTGERYYWTAKTALKELEESNFLPRTYCNQLPCCISDDANDQGRHNQWSRLQQRSEGAQVSQEEHQFERHFDLVVLRFTSARRT